MERFQDFARLVVSKDPEGTFCEGTFETWDELVRVIAPLLLLDYQDVLDEYPDYLDTL